MATSPQLRKKLFESAWISWERLHSDHELLCKGGRQIIQNPDHKPSSADLLQYVRKMKELADQSNKKTLNLIRLTTKLAQGDQIKE